MNKIANALGLKNDNDNAPRFFFRVRTVHPNDGEALNDLAQRNLSTAGNLNAEPAAKAPDASSHPPPDFHNLAQVAPVAERAGYVVLVAEACEGSSSSSDDDLTKLSAAAPTLPHRILGYAMLTPFRKDALFNRTARAMTLPLPPPLVAAEDRRAIVAALIRGCVRACGEKGLHWRVLMAEVPFRENHVRWREYVDAYEGAGFREVGRLEKVLEEEGELSDLVFLQYNL